MAIMHRALLALVLSGLLQAPMAGAQQSFITVASTTSTEQSGLFKHLLPIFEKKTGIQVRVVAQGTGQALDMGRRGDADVVFVHDKVAEEKFVADGFGVQRFEVMYNDFVLVGPKADPAKIAGGKNIVDAYKKIAAASAPFASRGDKSGTHAAELRLWKSAGIDPQAGKGGWYRETGSGMGPTLNTASSMNAYAFTDRGTWLSFKNRGDLVIVVEGDQQLTTSMVSCWSIQPNIRMSKENWARLLSTGWFPRKARRPLPTTRLVLTSCFSRTLAVRRVRYAAAVLV